MATHHSGPTGIDHCLVVKPGLKKAITCHVSKSPANKQLMCSSWALPSMEYTLSCCKREAAASHKTPGIKGLKRAREESCTERSAGADLAGWGRPDLLGWLQAACSVTPVAGYNDREDGPFWTRPWCPFSLGVLLTIITLPYSGTTSLPVSWH